jgi:hypothetical protein
MACNCRLCGAWRDATDPVIDAPQAYHPHVRAAAATDVLVPIAPTPVEVDRMPAVRDAVDAVVEDRGLGRYHKWYVTS